MGHVIQVAGPMAWLGNSIGRHWTHTHTHMHNHTSAYAHMHTPTHVHKPPAAAPSPVPPPAWLPCCLPASASLAEGRPPPPPSPCAAGSMGCKRGSSVSTGEAHRYRQSWATSRFVAANNDCAQGTLELRHSARMEKIGARSPCAKPAASLPAHKQDSSVTSARPHLVLPICPQRLRGRESPGEERAVPGQGAQHRQLPALNLRA